VRATEKTHSGEAIAFYTASIEHLVDSGQYEQAVELIARLAELRPAGEHNAHVLSLKVRHGRKRNFMKLLG